MAGRHSGLSREIENIFVHLKEREEDQVTKLRTALEVAREFEVPAPELPKSAEEYFEWFQAFVDAFERSFPMSRIDHYYFLFGRKVSEIMVNMYLAAYCIELRTAMEDKEELTRRIDKCMKDNEYILFKLIAPAALLSSEPRQNFFNVFYRTINGAFEPFRGIDCSKMDNDSLLKLTGDLRAFGQEVARGYVNCETQLKELGF